MLTRSRGETRLWGGFAGPRFKSGDDAALGVALIALAHRLHSACRASINQGVTRTRESRADTITSPEPCRRALMMVCGCDLTPACLGSRVRVHGRMRAHTRGDIADRRPTPRRRLPRDPAASCSAPRMRFVGRTTPYLSVRGPFAHYSVPIPEAPPYSSQAAW